MVPKGCQFTIPYGSIGTPWKVLVGWPGYRVTTPTISHTIRVGQTGQPWVGDEKPSRQNSWMEMKMSNGEYEPSSNFCITEFSVLDILYIYITKTNPSGKIFEHHAVHHVGLSFCGEKNGFRLSCCPRLFVRHLANPGSDQTNDF